MIGGNPEVQIPASYGKSSLSYVDLSALSVPAELVNVNVERTQDASWVLKKDLDCTDVNGDEIPDPAGLANTDLMSDGRGKL